MPLLADSSLKSTQDVALIQFCFPPRISHQAGRDAEPKIMPLEEGVNQESAEDQRKKTRQATELPEFRHEPADEPREP